MNTLKRYPIMDRSFSVPALPSLPNWKSTKARYRRMKNSRTNGVIICTRRTKRRYARLGISNTRCNYLPLFTFDFNTLCCLQFVSNNTSTWTVRYSAEHYHRAGAYWVEVTVYTKTFTIDWPLCRGKQRFFITSTLDHTSSLLLFWFHQFLQVFLLFKFR